MSNGIEAITLQALTLALDAASLRHQAITTNIANANVPGYAPVSVHFEQQLQDARSALATQGRLDAPSLAGVQPELRSSAAAAGVPAGVLLDVEAAHLAQNSLHFQALLKGLNRHYQIVASAVSDGRK